MGILAPIKTKGVHEGENACGKQAIKKAAAAIGPRNMRGAPNSDVDRLLVKLFELPTSDSNTSAFLSALFTCFPDGCKFLLLRDHPFRIAFRVVVKC